MKKILILLMLLLAGSLTGIYPAFKTFTEKVNPFNKFMDPVDGVDLYSGTVAFTKTLYEMKGRNGLDIGINLKYSSNVYMSARARNDKSPTGWLGLGWSLSYGSIRRDHKGTTSNADDEYYWSSPEGYEKKLFVSFPLNDNGDPNGLPTCAVEDFPYIKVTCNFEGNPQNPAGKIVGWTVQKPDGTKLHYGDYNGTDAVRNTFAVNSDVQPELSQNSYSEIVLYPYQWDLSDIEDNFGNHIIFEYEQVEEEVTSFPWIDYATSSPDEDSIWKTSNNAVDRQYYTKGSYIKTITNPENEKIEFETIAKDPEECYDPHQFPIPPKTKIGEEPDAFIEIYETKMMKNIQIKNAKGEKIKEFIFEYGKINDPENTSNDNPFIGVHYFQKSLLSRITEKNGVATPPPPETGILNIDEFFYNTDLIKSNENKVGSGYESNYNYGALNKHRNLLGYVAEYEYERKMLDATKTTILKKYNTNVKGIYTCMAFGRITSQNNPFCVFTYVQNRSVICVVYNWDGSKWVEHLIDIFEDGDPMFCLDPPNSNPNYRDTCLITVAGNDYFALLGGSSRTVNARRLCVYSWNETSEKWNMVTNLPGRNLDDNLIYIESNPDLGEVDTKTAKYDKFHVLLYGMPDYFVVVSKNIPDSKCWHAHVDVYDRFQSTNSEITWKKQTLMDQLERENSNGEYYLQKLFISGMNNPAHYMPLNIHLQEKEIVVIVNDAKEGSSTFDPNLYAYRRVGHKWELKKVIQINDYFNDGSSWNPVFPIVSNDNWFYYPEGNNDNITLKSCKWDGNSFLSTRTLTISSPAQILPKNYVPVLCSPFDIVAAEYPGSYWNLRRWNGYDWGSILFTNSNPKIPAGWEGEVGASTKKPMINDKYCVFYNYNKFNILTWDNFNNKWKIDKNNGNMDFNVYSWYGSIDDNSKNISTSFHDDYFISHSDRVPDNWSTPHARRVWYRRGADIMMWNGISWQHLKPDYPQDQNVVAQKIWASSSTNDVVAFLYSKIYTYNDYEGLEPVFLLRYKFQNSFADQIYTYVVKEKRIKPGFGQKEIALTYEYPEKIPEQSVDNGNGNFDTRNNTAKFNEVKVVLPNNSKVINYYFNDRTSQNGIENYRKLDGLMYSSKSKSGKGKLVAEQNTEYEVYFLPTWLSGIYDKRVIKNQTKLDGVKTDVVTSYVLNQNIPDINGQPRYRYVMNSDGRKLLDYTLYAHERTEYAEFVNKNMLTQQCMQITIEGQECPASPPAQNWYTAATRNVRSAQATTWRAFNGIWAPAEQFTWNVPKDGQGIPEEDFIGFSFNYGANHTNWQFQKEYTKYNLHGQILEIETPGASSASRVPSATIYRNDLALPCGDIINGKYDECAVFTGDYNMDINGYFDEENQWAQGGVHSGGSLVVNNDHPHFGQKSLYVKHSFGPTRNIMGVQPNTDYIFSAWVYPVLNNPIKFVVEEHVNGSASPTPGAGGSFSATGLSLNTWQLISYQIPSSSLPGIDGLNGDYLRIWIGNGPGPVENASDFYVDDIRFYPADAFVTTTYYDEKWEKPMLVVDANNNPGKKIDLSSFYDMKSVSQYGGNIGFQPSDALKINLFHDEIWESSAYKDKNPEGKITYDDFGRPVEWHKMNHNGDDTLIVKKVYHTAGFNTDVDNQCRTCNLARETDSLALCKLYNSTNGASWTNKTNWLSANTIDTWYGVTVSGDRVTQLILPSNNLDGEIPDDVGILTHLTTLDLSGNQLDGAIPDDFGYLVNLQYLKLNNNTLSGEIPSQLENLRFIEWLYLQNNEIEGSIPSSLGNCTSLRRIYLQENNLEGTIPSDLQYITNLEELVLYGNELNGEIPAVLSNCTNLQKLHLNNNKLIGSVPGEFGILANILELFVQNNELSQIDDELVTLQSTCALNLDNNQFCLLNPAVEEWADTKDPGWQSTQECNYREIDSLELVSMYYFLGGEGWTNTWNLSSAISTWYGVGVSSSRVVSLNLSNNNLTGQLSENIENMRQLQSLNLSSNMLTGYLPSLDYLENLTSLQVQNNQITSIDESALNWSYVPPLDIGNNFLCTLSPALVSWASTHDPDWQSTQSCNYRAVDSLALYDIYRHMGGAWWTNVWNLSMPITTWYGITVTNDRVTHIQLDNNNLSGSIPASIGNLRQLQVFSVQSDSLCGSVPSELSYCASLTTLNLRDNKFFDLGLGIENLTGVSSLDLGENNFCNLSTALRNWATSKDQYWESTQVCE